MTEQMQIYKCDICGQIIEVLHKGVNPYCCNAKMVLQQEKTQDAATEKHVPFIEKVDGGVEIRIGQNQAHPMTEDHYIMWIEACAGGKVYRQFLAPGQEPKAFFPITDSAEITAREYCNIHGLWKG